MRAMNAKAVWNREEQPREYATPESHTPSRHTGIRPRVSILRDPASERLLVALAFLHGAHINIVFRH